MRASCCTGVCPGEEGLGRAAGELVALVLHALLARSEFEVAGLGRKLEEVAGLTVEGRAELHEGGEPDSLDVARANARDVHGTDVDSARKLVDGDLPLSHNHIESGDDFHGAPLHEIVAQVLQERPVAEDSRQRENDYCEQDVLGVDIEGARFDSLKVNAVGQITADELVGEKSGGD